MKILLTGAAGFIGSALVMRLLDRGDIVVGVDNHSDYYDTSLKEARILRHVDHNNYSHERVDICDKKLLDRVFNTYKPKCVVNLAAQAGVRYSSLNPLGCINTNIIGFANILDACRQHKIEHLVYASSSSVYGANTGLPFSIHDDLNHPLSVYAASKKSNELLAHTYSHLYQIPTTGLRFFTVYGPWGRPDMALFKFTKSILAGEPIDVFNNGNHYRDFTYIDDIVDGIVKVIDHQAKSDTNWRSNDPDPGSSSAPWRIYNIANNKPVNLLEYISILETELGVNARLNFLPLQPGDLLDTYADMTDFAKQFNYIPTTPVRIGIRKFVAWYRSYYKILN